MDDHIEQIAQAAETLVAEGATWTCYFRKIFSVSGLIRQLFPDFSERRRFQSTRAYNKLQRQLKQLRETNNTDESERVVTVRLPSSMHRALIDEAHEHRTSLNKLCISKLLQPIDPSLVPSDVTD